jgi:hypothetical protein
MCRVSPNLGDPENALGGVVTSFLAREPLRGHRTVMVTDQRARVDVARCVRDLAEVHSPDVDRIVLVLDQLNTHAPAALYAAFSPVEARRLTEKPEIHDTPRHGSWLNMAELDVSVRQRRRVGLP